MYILCLANYRTQLLKNVTLIAVKQRYTKTVPNSRKNLKRFVIDWLLVFCGVSECKMHSRNHKV